MFNIVVFSTTSTIFLYRQHHLTMHQSNDIDDAMNNAVMVINYQQKRRLFYVIFVLYIFIFMLYWMYSWAMML